MKLYIITKSTDAYHASRCSHEGRTIRKDGATPVEWVYDDNYGRGYNLNEARRELNNIYKERRYAGDENIRHRYFDNFLNDDVYTYSIIEMLPVEEEEVDA